MRTFLVSLALFALVLSQHGIASAHEFLIKPDVSPTGEQLKQKIPFGVISCHVFMKSEEMEPIENVEVFLVQGKKSTPVKLHKNESRLTLDGEVEAALGTSIIAGHRQGIVWTKTSKGWKQGSKTKYTGVLSSGKYEKFCKTLIKRGKNDEGWKQVIGHNLEIVPLQDPSNVKIGEELAVRIMHQGKPLTTKVWATIDGFSDHPNTWAYCTESDNQGTAYIKITAPGLWMIRTENINTQETKDYDKHVQRANLLFTVEK